MPLSSTSTWKSYFSSRKELDKSNLMLSKIKESVLVSMDFSESFEISSKNESISFISLDPSELEMQIFHHRTILGGSWSNPKKHLIAILASDSEAKPIQILPKFIKDLKLKTISPDEFISSLSSEEEFIALKNQKQNSFTRTSSPYLIF
jgi:hypothetical protein